MVNDMVHERLHRGAALMQRMARFPVVVCGAGALGANIVESLARSGMRTLTVIDRDRIEERNLSTQPWTRSDIGASKATILAHSVYRATGAEILGIGRELTDRNVGSLLSGAELVVDVFDNSTGREVLTRWSRENEVPCIHAGLASDFAEVLWNDIYRVPSPANDDVCDYPLARNLVTLTVALACETIIRFVEDGRRESRTLTFADFAIREVPGESVLPV